MQQESEAIGVVVRVVLASPANEAVDFVLGKFPDGRVLAELAGLLRERRRLHLTSIFHQYQLLFTILVL